MTSIIHKFRSAFTDYPATCDLLLITLVYTLAHGLMLFNQGIYWDDWVLHNMDSALIVDMFKQAGSFWSGYLHVFISGGGVITYRMISFFSFLLAALCLFGILRGLNVDRYERLFIVIYFAIFPVNNARISMITMPYSLCYALFFCGFWLTTRYLQKRTLWYRIAALLLLFVSFSTRSLLVFYSLIILYIMYSERPEPMSFSGWIRLVPRYADYLLLPILFWFIKICYFKPYAWYADYNETPVDNIKEAVTRTLTFDVFDTSFLAVIANSAGIIPLYQKISAINPSILLGSAFVILFSLIFYGIFFDKTHDYMREKLYPFLMGAFAFWLAAFPYLFVNKVPQPLDWYSRHQLLLPLGSALLLVYGVKFLNRNKAFMLSINLLLVFVFAQDTMLSYISFQRDWFKQVSLIENLRESSLIKNHTSFLFSDKTHDLNSNQRAYRFYEYTGMMKKAFGDEKRFGHDLVSYSDMRSLEPYMSASFNLADFEKKEPDKIVEINYGSLSLNTAEIFNLLLLEHMNKPVFRSRVLNVISLNVQQRDLTRQRNTSENNQ